MRLVQYVSLAHTIKAPSPMILAVDEGCSLGAVDEGCSLGAVDEGCSLGEYTHLHQQLSS